MNICVSLLLAATFGSLGLIYRSRIQTYCALAAGCFALHGTAAMIVPEGLRDDYQTLFVSVSAVLFGLVSWLVTWLERRDEEQILVGSQRLYDCWQNPPLPLVSLDASLWARPLAHVSIIVAFLGLFFVGNSWVTHGGPYADVWLTVIPIYLAAAAWFICTKTHRPGWFQHWTVAKDADLPQRRTAADRAERGVFYVLAIITAGAAIHLTVHLIAIGNLPLRPALSWHLLLAATLSLVGWVAATMYTIHCQKRIKTSDPTVSKRLQTELQIYGGLLHIVVALNALIVLVIACGFGIPPHDPSALLLGSLGLLILFFGLASGTYRSQLGSYLSILAVGLATIHIASMIALPWPSLGSLAVPATALLALALVSAATFLARYKPSDPEDRDPSDFYLPSPWSEPPLPMRTFTPLSTWLDPLRNLSIFFAVASAAVMVAGGMALFTVEHEFLAEYGWMGDHRAGEALMTCLCVAATFAVAARLYQTSLLTYLATIVLAVSTPAVLELLGQPSTHLGIAIALLAMACWSAGFIAERFAARRNRSAEQPISSILINVYEQPLIRSSACLAAIAIGHSLLVWRLDGWLACQTPLVITLAISAVTLMLNARSLSVLERVAWARMMVYLACFSLAGCWLAASSMTWKSLSGLGPNAALTALVLGTIGLLLVEHARSIADSNPTGSASRLTFGEPISHFASGLSIVAILLAAISVIRSLGLTLDLQATEKILSQIDLSAILPLAGTLLISAAVCLLSVRVQKHVIWLYGTVVLGSGGALLLIETQMHWEAGMLAIVSLLVMNILVSSALIVRANRPWVESLLGLSHSRCERPFYEWPLLLTALLLVGQSIYLAYMVRVGAAGGSSWPWLWVNLLGGAVFFQVLYLRQQSDDVHLLLGSSVVGLTGIGLSTGWAITPDVALAMLGIAWGLVAGLLQLSVGKRTVRLLRLPLASSQRQSIEKILLGWSIGLLLLSLIITIPVAVMFRPAIPNVTIVLLIATLATVIGGIRWRSVHATTLSALLVPLCFISATIFYGRQQQLLEYGGLLAASLALVYYAAKCLIRRRVTRDHIDPFLTGTSDALASVSQLLSGAVVLLSIASISQASPALPTALSLGLTSVYWLWMAWDSDAELFAYGAVIGWFVTLVYAGNVLLSIPFADNSLAAFFVIGYSLLLYGTNVLVSRTDESKARVFLRPSYYVALALPISLIVAIPFDQRSPAAFALLAAGSFYLTVTRQSQTRWTMYVAALLMNFAIYLWVPAAREITGLYQLYVIPAAITVLIFAQLHRRELQPQVLSSIRLAASGAILAVSTFEVFFTDQPSLLQFVAVLFLSLAGITIGIAIRIKPFVAMGIAFLVLNVVGQLGLRFQNEGGIARAVILIGVGMFVLAAMIFFNIHRERILRQYRGFLVDNEWE